MDPLNVTSGHTLYSSIRGRIATSVFWIAWSRVGIQTLSLLSTLFVARLLSPRDFGLMALASTWTGMVTMLSEMGLGAAIVQFRDLEERELNACFWMTFGLGMIGYFALYVSSPALAEWFNVEGLSPVLQAVGLMLPLVIIRLVPESLLKKDLSLDKVSKAEMVGTIASIITVVVLAIRGVGVWALVAAALIRPFTQNLIIFWFSRWMPGVRIGGKRFMEVCKFSLATLGHKGCWVIYSQADNLVLGKFSGEFVLGFYSMAKDLALLPVRRVSAVVNQMANPLMAALQDDREYMQMNLLRGMRFVAYISFPLCTGMIMVSEDLVFVALGQKWLPCVPLIQLLSLYAFIKSIDTLLPPVLSARFRHAFLLRIGLVLLFVMPVTFYFGATRYENGFGVALAWVTIYPVIMTGMVFEVFRELQLTGNKIFHYLWGPVSATLVFTCSVYLTQKALSIPGSLTFENSVLRLVISSAVGALSYFSIIFIFPAKERFDMLKVLGWVCGPWIMNKIKWYFGNVTS